MGDVILTPGTLPPPACYTTEQDRYDAYIAATIATFSGVIEWQASQTEPSDKSFYWLRTDSQGRPIEALRWSTTDGAWVRWQAEVISTGTSGGSADAYALTNTPPMTVPTAYRVGMVFVVQAAATNTGAACTFNVDGLGAKSILLPDGATIPPAGAIRSGQMMTLIYDGTGFQLVSQLSPSSNPTTLDYTYYQGTSSSGTPPAPVTITLTKPAAGIWKEFEVITNAVTQGSGGATTKVEFKFTCGTISGNSVTTKDGSGNDGYEVDSQPDQGLGNYWRWVGKIPDELQNLDIITFSSTVTSTGSVSSCDQISAGRATYLI